MKRIHHGSRVGIELFVELHRIPSIFAPILPILYEHVERYVTLLELVGGVQNLFLRMETFAAMDVAQRPSGN